MPVGPDEAVELPLCIATVRVARQLAHPTQAIWKECTASSMQGSPQIPINNDDSMQRTAQLGSLA